MTKRFEDVLSEKRACWVKISGSREQRLVASVAEIEKLLARKAFASPMPQEHSN